MSLESNGDIPRIVCPRELIGPIGSFFGRRREQTPCRPDLRHGTPIHQDGAQAAQPVSNTTCYVVSTNKQTPISAYRLISDDAPRHGTGASTAPQNPGLRRAGEPTAESGSGGGRLPSQTVRTGRGWPGRMEIPRSSTCRTFSANVTGEKGFRKICAPSSSLIRISESSVHPDMKRTLRFCRRESSALANFGPFIPGITISVIIR